METAPEETLDDSRFHPACPTRLAKGWLLLQVAADFNKQISPVKALRNPARPRRHKTITMRGRSYQRLLQRAAGQRPAIRSYCKEPSAKDPRSMVPLGSPVLMWLAPKDLQAPADKVVQAALAVADSGLVAAVEVEEAVAQSLVVAVAELGAGQAAAREAEAHSAVEAAAVFFASK